MKRKVLGLTFALVGVMCLVFGAVGCQKKTPTVYELGITNKTALIADWYEGGADRTVELAIPNGVDDVKITSSDVTVVSVEGRTLKAIGAGLVKITAMAGDETDTVNVRVLPALREFSVANRAQLEKIAVGETRTVEAVVRPASSNALVTVASSNANVLSVNGLTVEAKATGSATLTVRAGNKQETVNVQVINLAAPTLNASMTAMTVMTNTATEVPVSALSCDGLDLRESVTATCPTGVTFDKTAMAVSVEKAGTYDVTFNLSDPRNTSLTASAVTVTVTAYRNVFGSVAGWNMVSLDPLYAENAQYVEDAKQVAYFERTDGTLAEFDMTPSLNYYAEVTFASDVERLTWSDYVGMTHSVKGDPARSLAMYVDRGAPTQQTVTTEFPEAYSNTSRTFAVKKFDITSANAEWECGPYAEGRRDTIYWSDQIYNLRGIGDGTLKPFPMKMAVARMGDVFYAFINDEYVYGCTDKRLTGKPTVAGIFQQISTRVELKNISWLTGTEAIAKFNTLTSNGSKIMKAYVPTDWHKNKGVQYKEDGTGNDADAAKYGSLDAGTITYSDNSALGANYTYTKGDSIQWGSAVSPHIIFDGDFTFEWDYTYTKLSTQAAWKNAMNFEVRNYKQSGEQCIRVSAAYGGGYNFGTESNAAWKDGICAGVHIFDTQNLDKDLNGAWYNCENNQSITIHYKVTRKCNADGSAKYDFYISCADAGMKSEDGVAHREYPFTAINGWDSPSMPVQVVWLNQSLAGTYSNISYSASVEA